MIARVRPVSRSTRDQEIAGNQHSLERMLTQATRARASRCAAGPQRTSTLSTISRGNSADSNRFEKGSAHQSVLWRFRRVLEYEVHRYACLGDSPHTYTEVQAACPGE
jgi:hypothetical protein